MQGNRVTQELQEHVLILSNHKRDLMIRNNGGLVI